MFVFACLVTRSVLRELNPKKKKMYYAVKWS